MGSKIITCSIPKDLELFLEENTEISPSKVLQSALINIREETNKQKEKVKALEIRLERATSRLNKTLQFVETHGLSEELIKSQILI